MFLNNDVARNGDKSLSGDSTELALLELSGEFIASEAVWPRKDEIPFGAGRRLMTTFHDDGRRIIAFTKGVPDVLLSLCEDIDSEQLQRQIDNMARKGNRVLGFAYRSYDVIPGHPESAVHERSLSFLGLTGIIDPPREGVITAVAGCSAAGITPVMITGDHPLTAMAIAQRIGIFPGTQDSSVTGQGLWKWLSDLFFGYCTG